MEEKKIQITKLRNNLNKIAKEVANGKVSIVVESLGKESIAIIPIEEYSILHELKVLLSERHMNRKDNQEELKDEGIFKFFNKGILPAGVHVEEVEELAKETKVLA